MKLIVAIVRVFKVTELVDAVEQLGDFPGMTVLECRGFGREKGQPHELPQEDLEDFVERRCVVVAVPEDQVGRVVQRIADVAHTGQPGDGKLFVLPLDDAMRIATAERGDAALR